MKKNLCSYLILSVAALVFCLAGCGDDENNGLDFSSHTTNYSIKMRNNTGERLVAFKEPVTFSAEAHWNISPMPVKFVASVL